MKVKDFLDRFYYNVTDCSLVVEDVTGQQWTMVEAGDGYVTTYANLAWADDLMDRLVRQITVKGGKITLQLKPLRRRAETD